MSIKTDKVVQLINELDLEPIAYKLVHPEPGETGMTIGEADEAVSLYRMSLKIIALHPGKSIVPTKLIDEVWHTHMLDTRKYAEDCEAIFGRFLHHFPYLGLRGEEDIQKWQAAFSETRSFFLDHFGVELPANVMECGGGCTDGGSSCDYNFAPDMQERPRLVRA